MYKQGLGSVHQLFLLSIWYSKVDCPWTWRLYLAVVMSIYKQCWGKTGKRRIGWSWNPYKGLTGWTELVAPHPLPPTPTFWKHQLLLYGCIQLDISNWYVKCLYLREIASLLWMTIWCYPTTVIFNRINRSGHVNHTSCAAGLGRKRCWWIRPKLEATRLLLKQSASFSTRSSRSIFAFRKEFAERQKASWTQKGFGVGRKKEIAPKANSLWFGTLLFFTAHGRVNMVFHPVCFRTAKECYIQHLFSTFQHYRVESAK